MKTNNVTSFFFYMWNAWSKEECAIAFSESNCGWEHMWNKWCGLYEQYGPSHAIPSFYAELSKDNRDLLVKRALEVYNEMSEIK